MSLDIALLALRIAIALALYIFLGAVLYFLWRDVRAALQTVEAERREGGRLVVVESASESVAAGREFVLLSPTTIGRALTNTVTLPDSVVSAEHARLALKDRQWWLEDLGSMNGTLLNGAPVAEPVVVATGDVIGIGLVKFRLEIERK